MSPPKVRIGDMLVQAGAITEAQLEIALAKQKQSGKKLGAVLIDEGFIEENKFFTFLAQQFGIPFVDLTTIDADPDTVRLLPETHARRYRAIVLRIEEDRALVGMVDPMDIFAVDDIGRILDGRSIELAIVRESELNATFDLVYRRTEEIESYAEALEVEIDYDADLDLDVEASDASAPVARLLDSIMRDAVQMRASDVHIEPDAEALRIRQRIDGVLHEHVLNERAISAPLVSRLKLNAGLNISERRLPQDGRFRAVVDGREVDVRLSTMPVRHGESVVMRLLDRSERRHDLDDSGMPPVVLETFRRAIGNPHGLVLVTGPTGSGKTTTLYGAVTELNVPETKIITAEDPVEFELERVNQVQVNSKIGLTFASVLRAALRQDPDVILLGEIRDQETAEIALRAALTGHLVLSTLHTNDAISAATRLIDMGADPFLVSTALRAVVAQRLVRKLCEYCAKPLEDPAAIAEARQWLARATPAMPEPFDLRTAAGCTRCNHTGFLGRLGVFEIVEVSIDLADALRRRDTREFGERARAKTEFTPLLQEALALVAGGRTTIAEAMQLAVGEEKETPADAHPTVRGWAAGAS